MHIVLLSGGSGKRLWPLSNNARSKQFLPLLLRENGSMESMVQRVVRQVLESELSNNITLATNISQLDIIKNQLGESVSIVTEPERRDTFPAIALAATYLKFTKGCNDDEVVVVMPCDPYTDSSYFKVIGEMAKCIQQNIADLVLMGICPTHASEKFGYIVPMRKEVVNSCNSEIDVYKVSRFSEKPSKDKASELLLQGALWNGGVFAFRLGFVLNIVRKYLVFNCFEDVRNRYSELPKISFDYEVVEKTDSVAVVPFSGEWKDLGTWNSFTDELSTNTIGNALLGDNCQNTHVVNELKQSIIVEGINDAIIAASPDGILVCNKDSSENIKGMVESLSGKPMYEEKRWGVYRILDDSTFLDGNRSRTKLVTINPNKSMSYHVHRQYSEVFTVIHGEGLCVLNGHMKKVKAGDTIIVPNGVPHAIKAIKKLTFIEVQSGFDQNDEDEILEWVW